MKVSYWICIQILSLILTILLLQLRGVIFFLLKLKAAGPQFY